MNAITKFTAAAVCALTLAACGGGNEHYTITPSVSGGGGKISPSKDFLIPPDTSTVFFLTPDTGYAVASVGGTCGGTLTGNVYTTNAITADCTVVATFAAVSNALTFRYETLSLPGTFSYSSDDLQTLFNQEGAKGYFYQQTWYWNKNSLTFVNDGSGKTYTYKLLEQPANSADFLEQLNAEGMKGYRYEKFPRSSNLSFAIYRKDSDSTATYTYILAPATATAIDFLAQANKLGQSGFLFLYTSWVYNLMLPEEGILYIKNNTSNATYIYDLIPNTNDFLAQLNSEGSKGYRALANSGPFIWDSTVYVKDQTQAATFAYQQVSEVSDSNPSVDQMNSYGAQGYAYWGFIYFNGMFYVKASNCSGFLCTVLNPPVYVLQPVPL